jgi:hypothetical protein
MAMEKQTRYTLGNLRAEPKQGEPIEFIISDETRDRHGTVLLAANWNFDNYQKNPVVGYQHNIWGGSWFTDPNPDMIIGKAEIFQEGTQTIGRVYFEPKEINELSWKIEEKVRFGSLRATSVGFMEIGEGETKKDENGISTYYFAGQELAEFSIVNIPSNPNAVKRTIEDGYKSNIEILRGLLGGNLTDEDIKKLTLIGLLEMLTGKKDIDPKEPIQQKTFEEIREEIRIRELKLKLLTL